MKKKLLLATMAAVAVLSSSISVCAAPQYLMPDGTVFDPEWYLEQNPDLASWPLGTSADALYQHYTLYGAQEGRKPYDELTFNVSNVLPYQGTSAETTQPQPQPAPIPDSGQEQTVSSSQLPAVLMRDGKQLTDEKTIIAVEGQSYPLAWSIGGYSSSSINESKDLINVMFRCVPKDSMDPLAKELLPNALPGYEWRQVQATFAFDPEVRDVLAYSDLYINGSSNWTSDIIGLEDSTIDTSHEYPALHQQAAFVVNHNGVDYSGCVFCTTGNFVGDYGKTTKQFFVLVPEGYSGGMSIILNGRTEKIRFDF